MLSTLRYRRSWMPGLVASIGLIGVFSEGILAQVEVTAAKFLKRSELPDEFRFPLMELNYAVLQVTIENPTEESVVFSTPELEVRDPRGRKMDRARPIEITPHIMNSGRMSGSGTGVHGNVGESPGDIRRTHPVFRGERVPSIGGGGPRMISADTAGQIREILEYFEVREIRLEPEESVQLLVYLRSKEPPSRLAGAELHLEGFPPLEAQ